MDKGNYFKSDLRCERQNSTRKSLLRPTARTNVHMHLDTDSALEQCYDGRIRFK